MNDLSVTYRERITVRPEEGVAFGRAATTPGATKGWDYDGRFIELGDDPNMHRIWGEIVWRQGLWCVRSLGTRDGLAVQLASGTPIPLGARKRDAGGAWSKPEVLAIAESRFDVLLANGVERYRLSCQWDGLDDDGPDPDLPGQATRSTGEQLAPSITELGYRVLWHMSREYRLGPPEDRPPQPLSYARVNRALGAAKDSRQAEKTVERLVIRLREAGFLPDSVLSHEQRDWMCRLAVDHGLLQHLEARYGSVDG